MCRLYIILSCLICVCMYATRESQTGYPIAQFSDVNKPHPRSIAMHYSQVMRRNAALSNRHTRRVLQERLAYKANTSQPSERALSKAACWTQWLRPSSCTII